MVAGSQSKWVDRHLSNLVKTLKRYTNLRFHNFAKLLHLSGDYQVTKLQVAADDWLSEHSLTNLGLRQEGIIVLGVTRSNGRYIGSPNAENFIRSGDTLILYVHAAVMQDLDQRKPGLKDSIAHHQSIADQEKIEQEEKEKDAV